jgi:Skp family chaperone for outer membrane proteins
MKKCVMDNFRVLMGLEELAKKAIKELNGTRDIRSLPEASKLRQVLQAILDKRENKLEKTLQKELVAVLGKVAEFAKDKERSFKSEKLKKLGSEVNDFMKENSLKTS